MAGAKAAEALRAEGFDGRLVLVGREPEAPYERPPLSKDYLRGESPREKALVHPASFYADHDVELLTEVSAVALDTSAQRVELDSGPALDFDRVLLATGSIPRRPPIPGADLDGVHVLRTLADADELRAAFARGGPVVLIGAGWIGCEGAAPARQLGLDVTLVDQVDAPLQNVLGAEIGGWFGALHAKHDVRLHLSSGVAQVEGDGAVRAVRLTDGTRIEAQTVVLAVGVSPDVHLALSAGLTVGDGLVVDDHPRTSHPGIFAAGDIASAWHPRYERHIPAEHWSAALNQGTAAGRPELGPPP